MHQTDACANRNIFTYPSFCLDFCRSNILPNCFSRTMSNDNAKAIAVMPVPKDSEVYNMKHPKRGRAIVFNHEVCQSFCIILQRVNHVLNV